jgi:hypothetical protein
MATQARSSFVRSAGRRIRAIAACAAATLLLPAIGAAQDAAPPKPGCPESVHRQFDFWLGHWDVFAPDGKKAGENRIESIAAGCALSESWTGRGGFTGNSLNIYDKTDRKWHQTWVDSSGGRLDLAGALEGNAMVLGSTGPDPDKPGGTLTQRITWTPNADGSVRQHWQTSVDGGKTWSTAFDGKYVRKN